MAINIKVAEQLVREVVKEKSTIFTHYVTVKDTEIYEVIVRKIDRKPSHISISMESSIKGETTFDSILGPKGSPCGCCGGSGRE